MDWKEIKTEAEFEVVERGEKPNCHMQQQRPRIHRRVLNKPALDCKKVMEIAKAYANLYRDRVPRRFPIPSFKGNTKIFVCPGCVLHTRCASHSAFFTLLCHISTSHSESSQDLFADVIKRHASFIQYMRQKLAERTKRNCLMKLRSLAHRKTFLAD